MQRSATQKLLPLAQAKPELLRQVHGIFFDIDDTFSSAGKITAGAYAALWRAHKAGLRLVPVTGRPAAWAEHMARMWPVDGVVAENGACACFMQNDKLAQVFLLDAKTRAQNRRQLDALAKEILRRVPGTALASDQAYRLFDLAIDFCEDVPALADADVARIVDIFHQRGAQAKVSSIHVNGWFGDYNKLGMCKRLAQEVLGVDLDKQRRHYLFVGDSPNDAPMFAYFPNAVGVANVLRFSEQLEAYPRFVTRRRSGAGFAELVHAVLAVRDKRTTSP